jgi:hypothetical protein
MIETKPASRHRSAALLAAGLLVAAGSQRAVAAASPSGSGAPGTATASASATVSGSASATVTDPGSGSSAASCPARVRITLGGIAVSNGAVTISFTHTGHGCSSARPTLLHVHQNLLVAPGAGSDPDHQRNDDFSIGGNHADQVTVPLLESVAGKCFVQVDAHADGSARGRFFPTATCPSPSQSSPSQSSPAPSTSTLSTSPAQSSSPPSSSAQSSTLPTSTSMAPSTSQSFLSASATRASVGLSFVPVAQQSQPPPSGALASTGVDPAVPVGLAVILLVTGAWLMHWARRPRRY